MSRRVLVAGIGNIFLGDDGFGVEVVQRLTREPFPAEIRIGDFGIRGLHLAYDLLDGYDTVILVDAAPRRGVPGTIYVIEHDQQQTAAQEDGQIPVATLMDAHGMDPFAVLALLRTLGGSVERVFVVGCEPANLEEGIGLSDPVSRAVDEATQVVRELALAEASMESPVMVDSQSS